MRKILIPLAATALVVAMLPFKMRSDEGLAVGRTPSAALREIAGYRSSPLDGEDVRERLGAHTLQVWRYEDASGRSFVVNMVVSGEQRYSIHRPELCLNAQNFVISDRRTESVGGRSWRIQRLVHAQGLPTAFAYRYFNQDGFSTASQSVRLLKDVWDRSVRRQIDRWVLLTVSSSTSDDAPLAALLANLAF